MIEDAGGSLPLYRDPPLDGPTNMARDEHLLYAAESRPAALRLYAWDPPTISLGYFQNYSAVRELPEELRRLAIVRRTTGGGAILHDREITYCLVVADALPIARAAPAAVYSLAHDAWRGVLAAAGFAVATAANELPFPSPRSGPFFCFEKPGRTDLVLDDAKLLGSAQRRVPGAVLQHGSLLLGRRYSAHPGATLGEPTPEVVARWCDEFARSVAGALGLRLRNAAWTAAQLDDVAVRRQRYASDEWTRRR